MGQYDEDGDRLADHLDDDDEEGVTCNRCGATGLEWIDTRVRWRLLNPDGKPHICGNDSAIDDFEVVE